MQRTALRAATDAERSDEPSRFLAQAPDDAWWCSVLPYRSSQQPPTDDRLCADLLNNGGDDVRFVASRPHMPGYGLVAANEGSGLLPWSWAEERLARSHNYWLSTTRPGGRPHTMPVWGVWWSDSFAFSTGGRSRKARNLAKDPRCTVAIESAAEAVVVEGVAELVRDEGRLAAISGTYVSKYDAGYPEDSHVYRVVPHVVFGIVEASPGFTDSTTRWRALL